MVSMNVRSNVLNMAGNCEKLLPVSEKLASIGVDPCTGMSIIGHCAAARILHSLGIEVAQNRLLAAAITEPQGGSDLRGVRTVFAGGEDWRVTGAKVFATNALYADSIIVYGLLNGEAALAYVEPGSVGVRIEPMELTVYKCSGIASIAFDSAPASPIDKPGRRIYRSVLQGLAENRVLVAALAVGLGRTILDRAVEWAIERGVAKYQAVTHRIARAHALLEAAAAMVSKTAETIDREGLSDWTLTSIAKYTATEAAVEAARAARRTLGGHTYSRVGEEIVSLQHHIHALEPAEGTQDIQLEIIARTILQKKRA